MCIRVDLADGTYTLVPDSEEGQQEGSVNVINAEQDPNPGLEEPKANPEQEGKPWSMTYFYNLYNYASLICAFKFRS